MASTTKLVLTMTTTDGDKNFSYNYANPEMSTTVVKALATALITNGSFFVSVPTATKAAKIVTTTSEEYDLSD